MSENVASGASSGDPLKSVADALETAVQGAKDGAVDAKASVEQALPAASRFLYTSCYTFSYVVVFSTVLIAKSIPTNNAIVNGFMDGARTAGDMVDRLKSRQITSATLEPNPSLPFVNSRWEPSTGGYGVVTMDIRLSEAREKVIA